MARGASKAHRQQAHKAGGHAMELWRMRSKVKKKKKKRKRKKKQKKNGRKIIENKGRETGKKTREKR
jgi:hypothetical protein